LHAFLPQSRRLRAWFNSTSTWDWLMRRVRSLRSPAKPHANRTKLNLELLEDREVPSAVLADDVFHVRTEIDYTYSSSTVTLDEYVNPTKSIIVGSSFQGADYAGNAVARYAFGSNTSSTNTVTVTRAGDGGNSASGKLTEDLNVVEFASGVSVQHFSTTMSNSATSVDVTIPTTVAESRSIVLISQSSSANGSPANDERWTVTAEILSAGHKVRLQRTESGDSVIVNIQVVTFDADSGVTVQKGSLGISSPSTTGTASYSDANGGELLFFSSRASSAVNGADGLYRVTGQLNNGTVEFKRESAGSASNTGVTINYAIVSIPRATVYSGVETFAAENSEGSTATPEPQEGIHFKNVSIPGVDQARTIAYTTGGRGGNATNTDKLGDTAFTAKLNTDGTLRLERGDRPDSMSSLGIASEEVAAQAAWFVVQLPEANAAPELTADGTLTAIATTDTNSAGNTVASIVADGSITDTDVAAPTPAPEAIAVTSVDNSYGKWQYSLNGTTWTDFSTTTGANVSLSQALLLDSGNKVRFVPTVGYDGQATFGFRAWDKTEGTAGGTVDPTHYGGAYSISNDLKSASITVVKPVVSIVATDPTAVESIGDNGRFTITRTGPTAAALNVTLSTPSGTATSGTDYTTLATTVTIAAGATTATVDVMPIADDIADNNETVIVSLVGASGYSVDPSNASATVTIKDALLWTNNSPVFSWTLVASPNVTTPSNRTSAEGETVSFGISASDPNGYPLTYRAVNLPAGISINSSTGAITGTVAYTAAEDSLGQYESAVIVSNDRGGSTIVKFDWTVKATPRSPSLTNPGNQSGSAGNAVSLLVSGSSPDGNPLYYSAEGLPYGLGIDSDTGLITGNISAYAGSNVPYAVTITVTDYTPDEPLSATQSFQWTVAAGASAPTFTAPPTHSAAAGGAVYLPVGASNPGGYPLTYRASNLPAGLKIDARTGEIYGTLENSAVSTTPYSVTVEVSDGQNTVSHSFDFNVGAVGLENPGDQASLDADVVSLDMDASNAGTGTLVYSASGLPDGLSIDTATGEISGTIDNDAHDDEPYEVTVTVTDGTDSASQTILWQVDRVALEVVDDRSNLEGAIFSLQLDAANNVNAVTYSAVNLPTGLTLNSATGEITGTIGIAAYGQSPYRVTVTAADGTLTSSRTFIWSVTPQIAIVNPGVQGNASGDSVSLAVTAVDRSSGTLSYSAVGLPDGLSINTTTGEISGTLTATAISSTPYVVTLTATNGTYTSSQTFSWAVSAIYLPTPEDQYGLNEDAVTLSVAAAYHGAGTLTYGADGLPDGLSINTATGEITGTIAATADADGPYEVTITVTDGTDTVEKTFDWNVAARLTVFAIGEQSNVPGEDVSLFVDAFSNDEDEPNLTYSATGLPDGLTIDSDTGEISGTITDAVSTTPYEVTITVDDGTTTTSTTFDWLLVPVALTDPGDQANIGEAVVSVNVAATVATGYTAVYSASGLPDGLSINTATGEISGTLDSSATGENYIVTVSATADGVTKSVEFGWRVAEIVVASVDDQEFTEGDTVSLTVAAQAMSGTITFSADGLPDGLSINTATGEISGTLPADSANGFGDLITIIASNGTHSTSRSFYLTVASAIQIDAIDDLQDVEGNAISLAISASGGGTLSYSASGLPDGLSINSSTGAITGTATNNGVYNVIITATDGTYTNSAAFGMNIWHASNSAPVLSNPGLQSNIVGDSVHVTAAASDADGDTLYYSAEGLPYGLYIDPETGVIQGSMYESNVGQTFGITVTADDNNGGVTTQSFSWVVNNSTMTVAAASLVGIAGEGLDEIVVATFTNTDPYWAWWEFTATVNWGDGSEPEVVSIDGEDGVFTVTGSHAYRRAGTYTTTISITDGYQTVTQTGSVEVSAAQLDVSGGLVLGAAAGKLVDATVASFTGNKLDAAGDFAAVINWGDGTTSAGLVEGSNGAFIVRGFHTYVSTGDRDVTVTITDLDASTDAAESTIETGELLAGLEATLTVATFQSNDPATSLSNLYAEVVWGDGSTSDTTGDDVWITYSSGVYTVHARHAFDEAGEYTVGVTVEGPADVEIEAESAVDVKSPVAQLVGKTVAAQAGATLNNVVLATFTVPGLDGTLTGLEATVKYATQTIEGIVQFVNGVYQVLASGITVQEGSTPVEVEVAQTTGTIEYYPLGLALLVGADPSPSSLELTEREELQKFKNGSMTHKVAFVVKDPKPSTKVLQEVSVSGYVTFLDGKGEEIYSEKGIFVRYFESLPFDFETRKAPDDIATSDWMQLISKKDTLTDAISDPAKRPAVFKDGKASEGEIVISFAAAAYDDFDLKQNGFSKKAAPLAHHQVWKESPGTLQARWTPDKDQVDPNEKLWSPDGWADAKKFTRVITITWDKTGETKVDIRNR
jgi:hypothetical protein